MRITITLENTDGEADNSHNLPRPSVDEAFCALSYACKLQSALSREELIELYKQIAMTTSCLVDCDIEENSLLLSSGTALRLSSPTPRFVGNFVAPHPHKKLLLTSLGFLDPSLIPSDKSALAHNVTTSFSTAASDRFQSPALSSSTGALSKPPSVLHNEKVHEHYATSISPQNRPMQSERGIESPNVHGKLGCVPNDFDLILQELDEITSAPQASDVLPLSYDGTDILDLHTLLLTGESGCQGIQSEDADGDATTTSEQETPAFLYDRADKLPSDSSSGRPSSGRGDSYSASESTTLDIPTTSKPTKGIAEVADRKAGEDYSTGQTSDNCQSGQCLSKHQPAVDNTPGETEHNVAEDSSTYDDGFLDSDIRAAVEEAFGFLGNTSGKYGSSSGEVTNTISTGLEPNASGPSLTPFSSPSPPPPENDDQHTLPNKEQPEIPPVSPEESSGIYRKRRYKSSSEPQPALPARNLRPRVDKSRGQEITRPSAQYEDHWKGRFSHHPVLATVPNDQRTEIERRSNGALRSDLPEFIDEHSKSWNSNGFWPSLLPCPSKLPNMSALPKGRQIWRYVQAIDAEGEVHYLKARLAYVKLYLQYVEELDRQKRKCRADQTAERQAITKICGTRPKDRKLFNEHKLRGARWWWSGNDRAFKLDPLILYILYNCRSILGCCSKFDELVGGLLTNDLATDERNFPKQISKNEVQEWTKDAKVTSLETVLTIHWEAWDIAVATSKASLFLSARSSTQS